MVVGGWMVVVVGDCMKPRWRGLAPATAVLPFRALLGPWGGPCGTGGALYPHRDNTATCILLPLNPGEHSL